MLIEHPCFTFFIHFVPLSGSPPEAVLPEMHPRACLVAYVFLLSCFLLVFYADFRSLSGRYNTFA